MKRLFLLVFATLAPVSLSAQQAPADGSQVHVVRPGDTLWGLAQSYLADPFRWSEIFGLNRDVVANPHWIYPAERIRIPGHVAAMEAPVAAAPLDGYVPAAPGTGSSDRTVFFPSSDGTAGAGSVLSAAQSADVSVVTPGDYYRAGRLVPEGELRPVGELVELAAASVVRSSLGPQIQPFNRVYMKVQPGQGGAVRIGEVFHLWRRGAEIRPFGRIHVATGVARVVALDGDVATVEVERLFDAVHLGDFAAAVEQFPVPGGVIPRPATGAHGTLVAFDRPQAVVAVEDLAYIDLGRDSGVTEGDEFVVVMPARAASYGVRPEMQIGRLQVVRVSGRTSAVRVTQLEQPALEAGQVVRLVGKMP